MIDPADRALAESKLALLAGYAGELEDLVGGTGPARVRGNVERRAAERLVQLVVEVTVDVNGILAKASGRPAPATSRDSFDSALAIGAVPGPIADRFKATYVGLRNRVVHDYDRVDPAILARSARRLVADARRFSAAVRSFLEKTK